MSWKGEVTSVVLKLVCNLRNQNQSSFTYLIQFIVYYERIIRVGIAFPFYVSHSGLIMLLVRGYFENKFCFPWIRQGFGIFSHVGRV